jgi:ribosomal protein S18 acetylase RimI-like enzyme
MNHFVSGCKIATMSNGKKVVIRFLNGHDRDRIIKFFQETPDEDIQFCKVDVKNPKLVDRWISPEANAKVMSLVAEDLETKRIIAAMTMSRGQQAALNIGEILQILVARPYQGLGLGSLVLDELLDHAKKEKIDWLKAEVALELKNVIKAFKSRRFEIRATLEDYFRGPQGLAYDVALMMRPLFKQEEEF